MKQTYDLIVPIGYACSCTQSLRKAGLQLVSFPWDWISVASPTERCRFICVGFKGFIDLEDLEPTGIRTELGNEKVVNRRTGIVFLHDFAFGVPIAEQYQAVAAKYARRAARLDRLVKSARRVLLVTVDVPITPEPTSVEECENAMSIMARHYPGVEFEYLLVNLLKGRPLENRIDEMPAPGFRRIGFDYKSYDPDAPAYGIEIGMVADFLKEEYCVREYRTKAEIAAHKAKRRGARNKKLMRKMEELGASNRFEYALLRAWRALRSIIARRKR